MDFVKKIGVVCEIKNYSEISHETVKKTIKTNDVETLISQGEETIVIENAIFKNNGYILSLVVSNVYINNGDLVLEIEVE